MKNVVIRISTDDCSYFYGEPVYWRIFKDDGKKISVYFNGFETDGGMMDCDLSVKVDHEQFSIDADNLPMSRDGIAPLRMLAARFNQLLGDKLGVKVEVTDEDGQDQLE